MSFGLLAARKVRCCTKSNSKKKEAGSVKRVKQFDFKVPHSSQFEQKIFEFCLNLAVRITAAEDLVVSAGGCYSHWEKAYVKIRMP